MKQRLISAGFRFFRATGAHRLLTSVTGGLGAILMFHHVRPARDDAFAPNRILEITPDFLDCVLNLLREREIDLVSLDEARDRLVTPRAGRRFAVLSFDDGYRDNAVFAAPILRRHEAPYTVFVTTGFAERSARLWWLELEEAIRRLDRVEAFVGGERLDLPSRTPQEKAQAYARVFWGLRARPEAELRSEIARLSQVAGGREEFAAELCMDWGEIAELARDPLCSIGVHTLTHPMLAKHEPETVRRELAESRAIIEKRLGRPALHLAYPVGDPTSAGPREFAIAREMGFATAVTTRPGMIFPEHADYLTALPRLSVNGEWQDRAAFDALLSGAPFALWNRGRRLNVA